MRWDYREIKEPTQRKHKRLAYEIVESAIEIMDLDKSKKGVLLCEGGPEGIDVSIYSAAYPELVVVPVAGCKELGNILYKILPRMRRLMDNNVFGIVDRDNLSKGKIRELKKQGIYCTKLPFIENIICTPEIIRILCRIYKKDYETTIRKINLSLLYALQERIKTYLPVNISVPFSDIVEEVIIQIRVNGKTIFKKVTFQNVMYVYRDKVIASTTADAFDLISKERYYSLIKSLLKGEHKEEVLECIANYLPDILSENIEY